MIKLTGVDGCSAGWFAITHELVGGGICADVYFWFADLMAKSMDSKVIAVDIPIGLTASGPRTCDLLARVLLGKRHSTVFPAPILPALGASSRLEASKITRAVDGRGVGAQAWHIYKKIQDVDTYLRDNPSSRDKVFEVHPELSFMAWNQGVPILSPKKTAEGMGIRRRLVASRYGSDAFRQIRDRYPANVVADDDIVDAFAALWTALRIHDGGAAFIPDLPEVDSTGLRMAIAY
jgi:predicted RNase H-like nuclease